MVRTLKQSKWARARVVGPAAWLMLALLAAARVLAVSFTELLMSVALLIIVPLGIEAFHWTSEAAERFRRAALSATAITGLTASISLVLPQKNFGGMLALAWTLPAGLLAMSALVQLLSDKKLPAFITLLRGAASAYLLVGAGWLVISRFGARPFGFPDSIVELTAIHFHFAGFAAPLIVASAVEWTRVRFPLASKVTSLAGLGVVAAMPMVAVGITASPALEVAGSALIGISLSTLGITFLFLLSSVEASANAKRLIAVSALAVLASMVLAIQYAFGQFLGTPALGISDMAKVHGSLNAFGFSLCGLLGWRAEARGD